VATVFLLLAGEERAYAMLERVALNHLRYPFHHVCMACVVCCVVCRVSLFVCRVSCVVCVVCVLCQERRARGVFLNGYVHQR
jgi:hypothetical protein